jgi:hypothetical protein
MFLTADFSVPLFPYYYHKQLEKGISSGRLFRSLIRINRNYWAEGWVNNSTLEKEVLIKGPESINRAMDGDEVVVEMLPEASWTTAAAHLPDIEQPEGGLINPEETPRPEPVKSIVVLLFFG